jgi:phytoene dehydrogenase-like protein
MWRACIIGAGSSGLAVVKALADRGIDFDCFERSDRVGGNWVYGNANGMSSAYRSLHTNSSRTRTQYADHPMPPDYPDFPHHADMARYFEGYADRFGLKGHITFNTTVVQARREAGAWRVTLDTAGAGPRRRGAGSADGHGLNVLLLFLSCRTSASSSGLATQFALRTCRPPTRSRSSAPLAEGAPWSPRTGSTTASPLSSA